MLDKASSFPQDSEPEYWNLPAEAADRRYVGFGNDPGTKTPMEVIGVVKDVNYTGLRDEIPEQAFIRYLGGTSWPDSAVIARSR